MSQESLLNQIESPDQVSALDREQLRKLSDELRDEIISVVSGVGGHLGASLGVVELTVALHHCFDSPRDKIVWDVGHQAYGHKILTGRRDRFPTIRQKDGISGFPKRTESVHDTFGVGHASTALSAALGYCQARDIRKENHHVIAVVGDGALTGGIAYEGLNNAGSLASDMIVILNDNEMSISPNVGALSRYLTQITSGSLYNKVEAEVYDMLGRLPGGGRAQNLAHKIKESLKTLMVPGQLFEALGFRYFGPLDGHDLDLLVDTLEHAKNLRGPMLIHLITEKGKGYRFAEADALRYHGVSRFDKEQGVLKAPSSGPPSYTSIFGSTLLELAEDDRRVVGITAAMPDGTGLTPLAREIPERFYDVGIAEQHAVTFAGGLACRGMKPVCAIYSTFLQRAYDQLIHDIALQHLNVFFVLDRAGVVGADGPTHHGVFDLAFLRCIPEMVIMSPKDENELRNMVKTGLVYDAGPIALRYPRGVGLGVDLDEELEALPIGKAEVLRKGQDVLLIAVGSMVARAIAVAEQLSDNDIGCTVVNARFVKPLDEEMFLQLSARHRLVATMEEGTLRGGFGSAVLELFHERLSQVPRVLRFGIPDRFVEHGPPEALLDEMGLAPTEMAGAIKAALGGLDTRVDLVARRQAESA